MSTVASEPTVTLDWGLPMTEEAQGVIFCRIRLAFQKATAIIDNPLDKKRYRMGEDELFELRNLVCLWFQIRDFVSSRMANFKELDTALCQCNSKDHELRELLDTRPLHFGVSMLPSAQREAVEETRKGEESASLEVERERLAVRDARWGYFQAALARDQSKLLQMKEAPQRLKVLRHRKQMAWRLAQAQSGERVIKAYQEKFMRCDVVGKSELAQQKLNEFRSFVAPCKTRSCF